MSEVKWIKITTDIFDDEKFALIDSMPEADAIELMWFKLLVFAGRTNNNGIFFFNDKVAYTDEMLANIFRRNVNIVRMAMKTFIELGMVEEMDGVYTIPNWSKHQSLDSYEKKKERDRINSKKYREKQKLLIEEKRRCTESSDESSDDSRFCSYSYSNSNSLSTSYSSSINNIIDYLNNKLGTRYRSTTQKTASLIKARLKEKFTEDDFFKVIDSKCNEWLGTEMAKFLRPETLFGTKFEGYLNQINNSNPQNNNRGNSIDWDNV